MPVNKPALSLLGLVALAVWAMPDSAEAQSFDCAKAGTAVEKQICDDPNIGQMDEELSKVYGALRKSLSSTAKTALRDSQRQWLHHRNACDTSGDCVTRAYVQRLRHLDHAYDVFTGWNGTFESWAEVDIASSNERSQNARVYTLTISGAGQNWTCDGSFPARLNNAGTALVVHHQQQTLRIDAAGTGLWVPSGIDAVIQAKGLCGASAPSFSGFFARTSTEPDQTALDSRLSQAGIESPDAVRAFLEHLKKITASNDRETFAGLVRYPFHLYDAGKVTASYADAAAFLKDYERIVTKSVLDAIAEAHYADLFVNYQGVMLGSGQVWFDGYGPSDQTGGSPLMIKSINP
ncbi:MAG: lysozyme inhibitor LprI family protein [Pseudomonadota bacterium]